jgi:hypothetical protein
MEKQGIYWDRADNSRIAGKQQIHNRLAFDEKGKPGLYIFSTCRQFIRTFPCLVYSSIDVEDVDTSGEDHIYDELRYVCMERPISYPERTKKPQTVVLSDPLDLYTTENRSYRVRTSFASRPAK